jgi:succinate dehydrogenase/fumarate reductase flavoprotein subunit
MTDRRDIDIIVIGAGASGMTAALAAATAGATVTLIEKSGKIGGTAAVSGGIVWAPINDHIPADDPDDRAAALAYFGSLAPDTQQSDVLAGFIDHAAVAVRFLEAQTRIRFTPLPGYPDYYLDRPGARPQGGRALDSGLFPYADLGDWSDKVLVAEAYPVAVAETPLGGGSPPASEVLGARMARDERGFGQALVGALLEACLAAKIDIRLGADAKDLVKENGRVVGIRLADGTALSAARGVILASGGFEWNADLARTFLRGPITHPASPPGNNGDGLSLAMAAGAALGNMTSAWWCPTLLTDQFWENGAPRATPVLIERTLPGSIIVNAAGRRFCNEAVNYSAIAGAFHAFDPNRYDYPNMPAWLVFDHAYKTRYPVASASPGDEVPDWMTCAPTLAALAKTLEIESATLFETVARFNVDASQGIDRDFQRGASPYARFYGDRSREGALATLGPLETAPFYAVPLHLGVLGTNGGARTDADGRVLGHNGEVIPGLYAVGNVMAAPTGGIYAGAGGTLGPALTYGYLAGRHAAGSN